MSHLQKRKERLDCRACITLDLAPLTSRALEEGYVQSTGPVVTISLSRPRSQRALSSLHTTHVLIDRAASATAAQKPALSSILAAGLPFPKSPSMQIQESERGLASDSERQEREERGWWSKRFHEVFVELSAHETVLC
ncbi:hypothetical protein EV363DRAFT_1455343 [Boletus edulis]|nr:hypothetical protein EV363DRAFT_1455343 [Boletus edulis]